MKKILIIPALVFIIAAESRSYDIDPNLFPALLFRPLTANVLEPRIGAMYQADNDKLRLDIGGAVDLYELYDGNNGKMNIGTEFMTYSRLRSEGNMKFPVETADYYFGINLTNKYKSFESRIRVAHISAHLVDGWLNMPEKISDIYVYSREFVDMTGAYNLYFRERDETERMQSDFLRLYGGMTLIFNTLPKNVEKIQPHLGFDSEFQLVSSYYFTGGAHLRYTGESEMKFPIAVQAGILLKTFRRAGIALNYYGYWGSSFHGLFFRNADYYNAVGFEVRFY